MTTRKVYECDWCGYVQDSYDDMNVIGIYQCLNCKKDFCEECQKEHAFECCFG